MRDIIPSVVLERIGTQYERAVTRALSDFQYSREKEDALTAALGATMSQVVRGRKKIDGQNYSWTTNTWTLGSHYGVIVSFAENGYTCCNAEVVANAEGYWDQLPSTEKRGLGEVLSEDLLECKVGSRDLSYNSRRKVIVVSENGSSRDIRFRVRRRTRTIVRVNPSR